MQKPCAPQSDDLTGRRPCARVARTASITIRQIRTGDDILKILNAELITSAYEVNREARPVAIGRAPMTARALVSIRWLRAGLVVAGLVAGAVAWLLVTNPAPVVPDSGDVPPAAPVVVKLHARWCAICMATKGAWTEVQQAYAGRVRFVVFDFTSDTTTEVSRGQAARLGLEAVFNEYVGETGTVLVLDGTTRDVRHSLHGHRDSAQYRAAIDAVLAAGS
jgi:hypothetical protein